MTGADNPYGSGFKAVTRTLKTEEQAKRNIDPARSRSLEGYQSRFEEPGLASLWATNSCLKRRRLMLASENSTTASAVHLRVTIFG